MARRCVYLHIGLPGAGGAFLEPALLTHAEALATAGILVPARSAEEMLRAGVEIRRDQKAWGYDRAEVEGTWAELCRRIFRSKDDAVVSHELLASASADQAALLLDGLAGRDVHLLVTARDPASQLVEGWRAAVKAGDTVSFARFRARVLDPQRSHPQAQEFWAAQDLGEVLTRWTSRLKPSRVHVLTTPRDEDPRPRLWVEVADLIGFDPERFPPDGARATTSELGAAELAVLRDVNQSIDGRIDGPLRRTVVRRYFAERVLGDRPAGVGAVSRDDHDVLLELAERWQKQIAGAGYDVRGRLDDLLPERPPRTVVSPDDVPTRERLRITTDALADVLVEVARLREHNEQLEVRNTKLEKKRKKLKRRLAEKA